jgi:hypothetical protein
LPAEDRVRVAAEDGERVVAEVFGLGDVAGGSMTKNAAGETKADAPDDRGLMQQMKTKKGWRQTIEAGGGGVSDWRCSRGSKRGGSRGKSKRVAAGDRTGGDLKDRMPTRQGWKAGGGRGSRAGGGRRRKADGAENRRLMPQGEWGSKKRVAAEKTTADAVGSNLRCGGRLRPTRQGIGKAGGR